MHSTRTQRESLKKFIYFAVFAWAAITFLSGIFDAGKQIENLTSDLSPELRTNIQNWKKSYKDFQNLSVWVFIDNKQVVYLKPMKTLEPELIYQKYLNYPHLKYQEKGVLSGTNVTTSVVYSESNPKEYNITADFHLYVSSLSSPETIVKNLVEGLVLQTTKQVNASYEHFEIKSACFVIDETWRLLNDYKEGCNGKGIESFATREDSKHSEDFSDLSMPVNLEVRSTNDPYVYWSRKGFENPKNYLEVIFLVQTFLSGVVLIVFIVVYSYIKNRRNFQQIEEVQVEETTEI